MGKELITDKEAICLLMLFTMGSTLILGVGSDAKNDAWLAVIAGLLMSLPVILIYSRLLSIFPGKDLFEILDMTLGRLLGKLVALIYIWYAFHLGALVLRNFGEFMVTMTMPETPIFVPMLGLGLLCVFAVRLGIEEIGRISAYLLPVLMIILLIVLGLAIPQFELTNLKPVLGKGLGPVINGGFSAFSFPFAESAILLGAFFCLKTKKSPFKVYTLAILFAGTLIMVLTIRNISLLGQLTSKLYFPSYVAVSRISVGDFIQRIEVTVSIIFVVGAFAKSSICLLVASRGIQRIFKLKDYRKVVIQLGSLMVLLSYIVYDTTMMMQYWAFKVYRYYAFPMQVIFPVIIWIIAEAKKNKSKPAGKKAPANE
ncbi:MAG: endospore germination permease [Bacillota bacterium]|nr:endospore germination permease [Bacillota bacterium]